MIGHSRLGPLWAVPSATLGIVLIGLNLATFPIPPAARGLADVGPLVGVYNAALAVRMLVLAARSA